MRTQFFDREDAANPHNGVWIQGASELERILQETRGRAPFFAELINQDGYRLRFGLGSGEGCAEFASLDGEPPYLMAVADRTQRRMGYMTFLYEGEPTDVARRYCLPRETVIEIARAFVESGGRTESVDWEELGPENGDDE